MTKPKSNVLLSPVDAVQAGILHPFTNMIMVYFHYQH